MASASKTVSEFITAYYGHHFAQAVEQIDAELVVVDGEITITEALEKHRPELSKAFASDNPSSERFVISFKTSRGNWLVWTVQGKSLLILTVTLCLMAALLIFGDETVVSILRLLISAYGG